MAIVFGKKLTKKEILQRVGNISQIAGAKEYKLFGGVGDGTRAIDVRIGGLEFTILPDRGMDIAWASYNGVPFSYITKPGVVAPTQCHTGEFARGFFAGLLTTCGTTSTGVNCTDDGEELPQHGRNSTLSAFNVCVDEYWDGDDFFVKIQGKTRQAQLFGENILFTRTITAKLGENVISIDDTLENQGFTASPMMMLYHFNFGYPLLDENSVVTTDTTNHRPRDDEAQKGIDCWDKMGAPIHGYSEQVFYHTPNGDAYAQVYNDKLGFGARIDFKGEQLEYLVEWKQIGEGDYALGLEPGTNSPEGRLKARNDGTLKFIESLEKKHFNLKLSIVE